MIWCEDNRQLEWEIGREEKRGEEREGEVKGESG